MDGKGTFNLKTPLYINNVLMAAIPYDLTQLNAYDIARADEERYKAMGGPALIPSIDFATQMERFAIAVEKANPSIGREDVMRMDGGDALRATKRVSRFFREAEAEDETEDNESKPEATNTEDRNEVCGGGIAPTSWTQSEN